MPTTNRTEYLVFPFAISQYNDQNTQNRNFAFVSSGYQTLSLTLGQEQVRTVLRHICRSNKEEVT